MCLFPFIYTFSIPIRPVRTMTLTWPLYLILHESAPRIGNIENKKKLFPLTLYSFRFSSHSLALAFNLSIMPK